MSREIAVTLLGGFAVQVGDRCLEEQRWERRRPLELVQLLALRPGQREVRDKVIDALWPDLDAKAGAANLRKTAHRARQVLGCDDAVVLRAGQVHLFPGDEVTTDLHRFHDAASAALADGDPERCAQVAATVPGPLLPGSPYDPWTQAPRRHAHRVHMDLLRRAGRWEEVLRLSPTDETAYQALMRDAIDRGTRAAAIRWFARARAALRTELGVAPSPRTAALHEEALAGLVQEPTPLVGRDAERARMRAAIAGGGTTVVVRGEAGIGKSAMCQEVLRSAAEDGWATAWADVAGARRPYGPLIDLAERCLAEDPDLWTGLPGHPRGVLSSLSDAVEGDAPEVGPLTRHQVLGAVTTLLRRRAGDADTVLVLDDAHRADQATVDVVLQLAATVADVAVILALRHDPDLPLLRDGLTRLDRAGQIARVDLQPLDEASAGTLVRRRATRPLEEDEVARMVRLGRGIPFVLGELAGSHGTVGTDLPRTVAEAVTARLIPLAEPHRAMLRRLSVAERDLDLATVTALTGAGEDAVITLLDQALEAGVLVVTGERYRFRHDLLRQALRTQVPPHHAQAVHRDAAERLAASGARPAAIATQWVLARAPEEAAPWCLRAAHEAMDVGAFADARAHIGPVLAHDPDHPAALRLEATCLDMLGDPAALTAYDAAIRRAPPEEVDDLVAHRALAQVKQGDPAGGLASIRGANPRSWQARMDEALTYAGAAALGATDPVLGTEKAAEVRRLALTAGDRAGLTIASWAHAAAAHARGDLHDMVLTDLRETTDLPDLAVRVFDGHLCMTQRFLYGSRPYEEVITFAEGLTEEAARLGAARGQAFGTTLAGEALMLSGHLDDAEATLTDALRLHRRTSGPTGEAHTLIRLAEIAHHRGDPRTVRALLDAALDLARSSDIGFHLLDRMYGARIALAEDPAQGLVRVEEAEAAVRGPLETCPGCRVHLTIPATIAAAQAGDGQRARDYLQAARYLTEVVMRLPAWDAAFEEAQGHVARVDEGAGVARQRFARAADLYADAGQPLDARRCRAASAG